MSALEYTLQCGIYSTLLLLLLLLLLFSFLPECLGTVAGEVCTSGKRQI